MRRALHAAAAAALAAAAPGCSFTAQESTGGAECDWSFSPMGLDPCEFPEPESLALGAGNYTYDADMKMLTHGTLLIPITSAKDVDGIHVVSVRAWVIPAGAFLHATGQKPVMFVSDSSIQVLGRVSAASFRPTGGGSTTLGAGADAAGCRAGPAGTGRNGGDDGGGGAGNAALGGDGGGGDDKSSTSKGGLLRERPVPPMFGGCRGADATPFTGQMSGVGGSGGGAIALVAKESIEIDAAGIVDAGGAGGGGAPEGQAGGGGGGSGGMVWVETGTLTFGAGATLTANGGQGGGGSNGNAAQPGQDGRTSTMSAFVPNGNGGGDGGAGGALGSPAGGNGASSSKGGGGGGGAVGFVFYKGHVQVSGADVAVMSPRGVQLAPE